MNYAIITTLICLLVSLRITKNIFAPTSIVSALWLFCILAYWIYPHNLLPLKEQFYLGISLWVGFFTFSALFIQSIYFKKSNIELPNIHVQNFYFIVSVISFPFVLYGVYSKIVDLGLTKNIFYNLRLLAVGSIKGLDEGTSKNYFAIIWIVSYLVELMHFDKKRKWIFIAILIINIGWAFIVMSKTIFLFVFISTLSVLLFKKLIKPRTIYLSGLIIFIFFFLLQFIRTSDYTKKDDLGYDFFSLYVLSGMPAYEKVKSQSSYEFGESTFRFIYSLTNKLNISNSKVEDSLLPYTTIDKKNKISTNVYTTLYPYYKDFGYSGIIFFAIFSGLFYGYIFKKVVNKDNPKFIVYSILITLLLTQFMNESLFSALSLIIQLLILSHLPYWTNKLVLKRRSF